MEEVQDVDSSILQFVESNADIASELSSIVRLPEKQRCFHSDRLIYYIQDYSIFVMVFQGHLQSPNTYRINVPTSEIALSINTIKVIEYSKQQRLLLLALGNFLYCWSLREPSKLLFQVVISDKAEHIVLLSNVLVHEGNTAYTCALSQQQNMHLIELTWKNRLSKPRITLIEEPTSILKTILPTNLFSLWSKSKEESKRFGQCYVLKTNHDNVQCLCIKDDTIWLYRISKIRDERRVVCEKKTDFIKNIPQLNPDKILNVWVQINNWTGPVQRFIFYIASLSVNGDLQLTKASRTLELSPIVNSLDETMTFKVGKVINVEIFHYDVYAFFMVHNSSGKTQVLRLNQSKFEDNSHQELNGKAVVIDHYIITEDNIINLAQRSSPQTNQILVEDKDEAHFQQGNKRLLETTPQLTAAISIYTNTYAEPTDLLEALVDKELQIETHIQSLKRHQFKSLISQVLFEQLCLQIQILLTRNLKDIYPAIVIAADNTSRPLKIFENTQKLPDILFALAEPTYWSVYLLVLQTIQEFQRKHTDDYQAIHNLVTERLIGPLKRETQTRIILRNQYWEKASRLYSLAIQLTPNETKFYEELIRASKHQQCLQLALKYKHYQIAGRLYAHGEEILTPPNMITLISDLNDSKKKQAIQDLALSYMEFLTNHPHKKGRTPEGIKLFYDFPEFNEVIYQAIRGLYPEYSWLLAMILGKPLDIRVLDNMSSVFNSPSNRSVFNLIHNRKTIPSSVSAVRHQIDEIQIE